MLQDNRFLGNSLVAHSRWMRDMEIVKSEFFDSVNVVAPSVIVIKVAFEKRQCTPHQTLVVNFTDDSPQQNFHTLFHLISSSSSSSFSIPTTLPTSSYPCNRGDLTTIALSHIPRSFVTPVIPLFAHHNLETLDIMRDVGAAPMRNPAEGLFSPLKRALRRREIDYNFIPSVVPSLKDPAWVILPSLFDNVQRMTYALTGPTRGNMTCNLGDGTRIKVHPSLPPKLRERLISTLTEMEAEVLDLGESIELNNFRRFRNDPRGRSEEDLGAWRSDFLKRWYRTVNQLIREVHAWWDIEKRKLGSEL